jgi:L,D-peptidoglycan transpeptidase YkuD (ErfK/YbiS/YcfS/YnhG family)
VAASQRTLTVVKGSGGSYATLSFWKRSNSACGFVNVFTDTGARVGANGITNGATRTQGTNTTPTGTYTMTEAFGLNGSPGTALTYRHVGTGDYWVEDNNSAYYNSYRNVSQGGFNASLPLSDPNGSELLSNYPTQYGYSIVVNFNRAPDRQTAYRGAGIFVHVRAGATAGCIATSSANVVTMLRTMRRGDTITIAA